MTKEVNRPAEDIWKEAEKLVKETNYSDDGIKRLEKELYYAGIRGEVYILPNKNFCIKYEIKIKKYESGIAEDLEKLNWLTDFSVKGVIEDAVYKYYTSGKVKEVIILDCVDTPETIAAKHELNDLMFTSPVIGIGGDRIQIVCHSKEESEMVDEIYQALRKKVFYELFENTG